MAGTCIGLYLAGRATVYGQSGDGNDLLSPGSFVVVQLYIQQLFQPLSVLGFTYRQLTEALTGKSALVLFYHVNSSVHYGVSAI